MMEVSLVRVTENPVEAIEHAASKCYNSQPTPDGRIMKSCYESGHHSVLEFAQFHFEVKGVSRALLAQLTRHRIAGFAVRSQRYVREDRDLPFVLPKSILNNQEAFGLYSAALYKMKYCYDALVEDHHIPEEDARYILPNATPTQLDITVNTRSLINFMGLRLCSRAQWEIRQLAQAMKKCVEEYCPEIGALLVPKCEAHKDFPFCTERTSCGRHPLLKDVYRKPEG
jgi:thymidylate synthase (FAD)